MQATVRVKGLKQLNAALKRYNGDLKRDLEAALKDAAENVAQGASQRFTGIDARTASGFRPRIRGFGRVVVEQRLGKTTGLRPDFGSLQMRTALLPALAAGQDKVIESLDHMLDTIGRKEGF